MRLEKLYLDGFGHFHKYSIDDISSNVTVFYGPNEAGKSTLLAFIRGILFEFPHSVSSHYPPLSGGKHGGRITISGPAGEAHTIERFGRTLNVRGPSGKTPDPKATLSRLTGGITQNHFNNIFAFSLDELHMDNALDDSHIYSAGQGVPRLPELLKSLEDRKRKIYNSRGRKKTLVTGILDELQKVDDRLKHIKKNAEDYREKAARKNDIDIELEVTDGKLAHTREELDRITKLREGWDDWVELASIKVDLGKIPQFDKFPEDPITRLDGLEKQIKQEEREVESVKEELRQAEENSSVIVHGEALLAEKDRIEGIRRDRSRFDSAVRDLPERQGELKNMENNLSERLKTLGKEWNESNLHDIDISVAAQDQIANHDSQLKEAEESARNAKVKLNGAETKIAVLSTQKQDIQEQLLIDSGGQGCTYLERLLDDRESLDKVQGWGRSLNNSVRDLPKLQGQLDSLNSNLEHSISEFGRDWNVDRLNTFDTSIGLRQEVDHFKKLLADAREDTRLTENLLEQENTRLTECQNVLHEEEEQMPEVDAPITEDEIDRLREALRTSRSRFNEYERARINHENLSAQLDALTGGKGATTPTMSYSRFPPVSMLAAGGALVAAGTYLGDSALILSIAGGAALFGTAVYLLATRHQGKKGSSPESVVLSRQTAKAESSTETARNSLIKAVSPLAIDDPTDDALNVAEARLISSEKALSAWKKAHGRVMDAQHTLKSQKIKTDEASQKAKISAESESKAQRQWQDWLEGHGLTNVLVPDTVIELIGRIKEVKSTLEQIRDREQQMHNIDGGIKEYLALVQQLADRYSISFDGKDHQKAKSVAARLDGEFERANKLVDRRNDIEHQIQQYDPLYDKAVAEEKEAKENLTSVQNKWRNWLREHNIQNDFTPNTMREFIARADAAVESLKEARKKRTRLATIENAIKDFRDKVEPLALKHNIPLNPEEGEQVAHVADILIERLETAQDELTQRKEAVVRRDAERQNLVQCEKRLQSANEGMKLLLQEGGASDGEDFRRRAVQHSARMDLERQRDEHDRALTRLSGPGERKDAFLESLNSSDLSKLDAENSRLKDMIGNMEKDRSILQEERGGINSTLKQLAGEEESSALRRRRNVLKEQLLEHASKWSQLVLEKTLLEMTQEKFERERQPDVIKHAQKFFSNITGKRYNRLYAPIGEKSIMAEDVDGNTKQPHELSRGTREQLYLALRFGLIQDLGERTERLPVVIDEVLVNFDPYRARLTAQSLELLAKTNQILVFTCHPDMRDLFVDVAGAKVVEIKSD